MKTGVSIETDEEYIPSDKTQMTRVPSEIHRESNPIFPVLSPLLSDHQMTEPMEDISEDETSTQDLKLVGNTKKYSIVQSNVENQQIATSSERTGVISRPNYGEVYVRHRVS